MLDGRDTAVARDLIEIGYSIAHKRWSETIGTTGWFCTERTSRKTAGNILLYRDATNLRIPGSDLMRPVPELSLLGNISRRD